MELALMENLVTIQTLYFHPGSVDSNPKFCAKEPPCLAVVM